MYVISFTGANGHIKPWNATRDIFINSQKFLTPSIIRGMQDMLGVKSIDRHRLSCVTINKQQEITEPRAFFKSGEDKKDKNSIILRGVLINPILSLGFNREDDAVEASQQTVCLCRNEDILYPSEIQEMTPEEFDEIPGFELIFIQDDKTIRETEDIICVGYNRYDLKLMYGTLKIVGDPVSPDNYEVQYV